MNSHAEPVTTTSLAWGSLVCAVLAFGIVPGVGAAVALLLARVAMNEGPPRTSTPFVARCAMLLAALNLMLCTLVVTLWLTAPSTRPPARAGSSLMHHRDFDLDRALPRPLAPAPANHFSEDGQVRGVTIGTVELVDLGADIDSLHGELRRQAQAAHATGQSMVVWVSAPDCSPCNGVSAALSDTRLQTALRGVRLVRVNRDEFAAELEALGIPARVIPGFAKLDENNRPVDYLDGGEWDEDLPHNMAPVLGGFLRGNYNVRRQPWRGTTRRKIIAL